MFLMMTEIHLSTMILTGVPGSNIVHISTVITTMIMTGASGSNMVHISTVITRVSDTDRGSFINHDNDRCIWQQYGSCINCNNKGF